jgi:hypothetical protein
MAELDMAAIEASISQMTEEDVRKQLMEIRTRQKVMQKKYHDPVKAKASRDKKAAFVKALAEKARRLGIYDDVLQAANDAADEKLAAEAAEEAEEVGVGK